MNILFPRAARGVTVALRSGKELPPPPPPTINPDYIQCPHCSRRFNKSAAERHINFCADQHKRLETRNKAKGAATTKAAEKQDRRTSYRPPLPSSGIRRPNDLRSTKGNLSQARQTSGKVNNVAQSHNRTKARVLPNRCNEDRPFDTSLPSSQVATTKTGLKARLPTKYSSAGVAESSFNKRRVGERLNPSAGYTSSTTARSSSGYSPPNFSHTHQEFVSGENDKYYMSRKVSNLQERKKIGAKNGYSSSSSAGAVNWNGAEQSDFLTSWNTHGQQNGKQTFDKDASHFGLFGNDFAQKRGEY